MSSTNSNNNSYDGSYESFKENFFEIFESDIEFLSGTSSPQKKYYNPFKDKYSNYNFNYYYKLYSERSEIIKEINMTVWSIKTFKVTFLDDYLADRRRDLHKINNKLIESFMKDFFKNNGFINN